MTLTILVMNRGIVYQWLPDNLSDDNLSDAIRKEPASFLNLQPIQHIFTCSSLFMRFSFYGPTATT